jgi:VanZ family protein
VSEPAALTSLLRSVGAALQRLPRPLAALATVAWMGVITALSAMPAKKVGGHPILSFVWNLGHAPIFGILAACLALCMPRMDGWPRLGRREVVSVLAVVLAFAVFDELHQGRVVGREASVLDLVTDLTGAACMLWIVRFVGRPAARDGDLRSRLALCVLLCACAAALSTWLPVAFDGVGSM